MGGAEVRQRHFLRASVIVGLVCCWLLTSVQLWGTDAPFKISDVSVNQQPQPSPRSDWGRWQMESQGLIPQPTSAATAHASNLVELPHDPRYAMAAFWFAGSQEAKPDVRIAMSLWSRDSTAWTPPVWVVDRHQQGEALGKGISHIGNPVAWIDQAQRLHLFVVGTGLGGWAASRVLHLRQAVASNSLNPDKLELEVVGQLPLSWFWNLSFLVRHAPLPLTDGGMLLPLHFEMGDKFPAFAWFNGQGQFQGLRRIPQLRSYLQPAPIALDDTHWMAFLRSQTKDQLMGLMRSEDGGKTWREQTVELGNHDSAVAVLRLPSGLIVMARNSPEHGRSQLVMQQSWDGLTWSVPQVLVEGASGNEFSYPSLLWQSNRLWVSYTHQRQAIGWQRWTDSSSSEANP